MFPEKFPEVEQLSESKTRPKTAVELSSASPCARVVCVLSHPVDGSKERN